jgi:hypothetical protein
LPGKQRPRLRSAFAPSERLGSIRVRAGIEGLTRTIERVKIAQKPGRPDARREQQRQQQHAEYRKRESPLYFPAAGFRLHPFAIG